ncbi:MAG: glycosyltransferase family 9 protein [Chloroflexota bacterium]
MLQARRFDVAVNLHGSGFVTNPLVCLVGAARVGGFHRPGEWCPDPEAFLQLADEAEPEVRRWLRLCTALGWPSQDEALEFPIRGPRPDLLADLPDRRFVVVHPGASVDARRWPAERFAAVGDALAEEGAVVVLTGSEGERSTTARVAALMRRPAIDVAGQTSTDDLAHVVAAARVIVANDTGVAHLADALRTPSVTIHVDSTLERWAALDRSLHRPIRAGRTDGLDVAIAESLALYRAHRGTVRRDAA